MFEARSETADSKRHLRINCILLAASGGGVVSFVKDEKSAGAERAEPVPKAGGVRLVNKEPMGNEES